VMGALECSPVVAAGLDVPWPRAFSGIFIVFNLSRL